jgi:hypothetical protein
MWASLSMAGLVASAPFCVSAQEMNRAEAAALPLEAAAIREELATSIKLNTDSYTPERIAFQFATLAREKLLRGGGGVIDGGGGNLASGAVELLDFAIHAKLTALDREKLRADLMEGFGARLQVLAMTLPGFQTWLESGFKKSWFLSEVPFDPKKCAASSSGVCQTKDAILWNRDGFQKAGAPARSFIVLKELITAHLVEADRGSEAKLAESLAQKIAQATVSAREVFNHLQQNGLLISAERAERSRAAMVAEYETQLKSLRTTQLESFFRSCERLPMDFSRIFLSTVVQYSEALKLCAPWVRPETDGPACSLDALAEMIARFNHSGCARAPLDLSLISRK